MIIDLARIIFIAELIVIVKHKAKPPEMSNGRGCLKVMFINKIECTFENAVVNKYLLT